VIIALWRGRPLRFRLVQGALLLIMFLSMLTFPKIWNGTASRADSLQRACDAMASGSDGKRTAKILGALDAGIEPGATLLRNIWR